MTITTTKQLLKDPTYQSLKEHLENLSPTRSSIEFLLSYKAISSHRGENFDISSLPDPCNAEQLNQLLDKIDWQAMLTDYYTNDESPPLQEKLAALEQENRELRAQLARPNRSTGILISLFGGVVMSACAAAMGFMLPALTMPLIGLTVSAAIVTLIAFAGVSLLLGALMGKSFSYRGAILGTAVGSIAAAIMVNTSTLLPVHSIFGISPLAMTITLSILASAIIGVALGAVFGYFQGGEATGQGPQLPGKTTNQHPVNATTGQESLDNSGINPLFQRPEPRQSISTRASDFSLASQQSFFEQARQPLSRPDIETGSRRTSINAFDPQDAIMDKLPSAFIGRKTAEKPVAPNRPSNYDVDEDFLSINAFGEKNPSSVAKDSTLPSC
ncbi:hypothetical protein N9Y17_00505 [Gammaproteobacteria bacterium]|nr:hypothetical protein [Gammaproteobacteria bacterium]